MKEKFTIFALLFVLLAAAGANAQYNNRNFSVSLNGVYTTTAQIFLYPNSSDAVLRNNSIEITHLLNPSFDIRYRMTDDLIIGLSTEYMKKTTTDRITAFSNNSTVSIPVNDGFELIPVELTVYYLLPFSTENFKFLMGGGGAYYYGSQIRKISDVEGVTTGRDFAYGIHVVASMDYLPLPFLSVRLEMKFRDPQFNLSNTYTKNPFNYNGQTITLPQNKFDTRINVDGISFILGTVFHFQL
jgi:hypothetical protein